MKSTTTVLCLATAMSVLAMSACGGTFAIPETLLPNGNCDALASSYATEFEAHGQLASAISDTAESYPMAIVLNQNALNRLFQNVANVNLPELTESTTVLGQTAGVSVTPSIPTLAIGGVNDCDNCIRARVPFNIGATLGPISLGTGDGAFEVQMPIQLVAQGDAQTALVAEFQSIEVLDLSFSLGEGIASNIFAAIEPLITTVLSQWLQQRFNNVQIATFDSFSIGGGDVLLAGRGPFVFPEQGTVMIAMQSNLNLTNGESIEAMAEVPEGADIGIRMHPGMLGAMVQRMLYEGVVPQNYDEQGNASDDGATRLTLNSVSAGGDSGMLRVSSELWRTNNLCGAATLSADVGLAITPSGVDFSISSVDVSNGRGSGMLLEQASNLAEGYLDAVLETMEVTMNYDAIFGGEAESETEMQSFEARIDGSGVSLFLNLVE